MSVGVAITNLHPLPCPHVFNNAHLGSWRVHAEFQPFWSRWLAVMPTHTYEPKYILKCVHRSNSFGPSVIQNTIFWHYFTLYTNGKRCSQEGFCPCHSKRQVVYPYHILSLVLPRVCLVKVLFYGFFLA